MIKGIYMTEQEIFKAEVLFKIAEKRLSQAEAAQKLGIFDRHIRRLYRAYKLRGMEALISKTRGGFGNHKLPTFLISRIKELIRGCLKTSLRFSCST